MTLSPLIVEERRRDLLRAASGRRPRRRSIRVTLRRLRRAARAHPAAAP